MTDNKKKPGRPKGAKNKNKEKNKNIMDNKIMKLCQIVEEIKQLNNNDVKFNITVSSKNKKK